LQVPEGWELLPPGDAAWTRRVKAGGPVWVVSELRGRKRFSRGVWAPAARIEQVRAQLEVERQDPAWQKRLERGRSRRAAEQVRYVADFTEAVRVFLAFSSPYVELGEQVARAIAEHATPVGSGTVARTSRIGVSQRAEAATIAWLRHQTTAYDTMRIPRQKGMRRMVRRMLAERSRELLAAYRRGDLVDEGRCPLQTALKRRVRSAAERPGEDPTAAGEN
jgi:hypothetical protein